MVSTPIDVLPYGEGVDNSGWEVHIDGQAVAVCLPYALIRKVAARAIRNTSRRAVLHGMTARVLAPPKPKPAPVMGVTLITAQGVGNGYLNTDDSITVTNAPTPTKGHRA